MIKSEQQKRLPLGMSRLPKLALLSRLRARLRFEMAVFVGALLILLLLSMGCASNQPMPCKPLAPPLPPALSEPLPSVDYSISVGQHIKAWANALTDTSTTSKP